MVHRMACWHDGSKAAPPAGTGCTGLERCRGQTEEMTGEGEGICRDLPFDAGTL